MADIQSSKTKSGESAADFQPGGRAQLRNVTMKEMITAAHKVGDDMVAGGPSWLDSDHFDIVAKAEP